MTQQNAIIVIPLHTTNLNADEVMSLKRTVAVLGSHPFAIACPLGLDLTPLNELLKPVNYITERFEPEYFKGIKGYNRLMLSQEFYTRFAAFEYLLICQADVFVFEDKLNYWCGKEYDYIGAPWIGSKRNLWNITLFNIRNFFKKKSKKRSNAHLFKVGNGGFSLRRVSMMKRIVTEQSAVIEEALKNPSSRNHHMEDIYFSLVAPTKIPEMKIPGYVEAAAFAFDRKPKTALKINGGKLPFACHGFNKPKVRDFWKPVFEKFSGH
jgi:Protein of unknown function (DUF5672)